MDPRSRDTPAGESLLASLPVELLLSILATLPPGDQICLGLTCKTMLTTLQLWMSSAAHPPPAAQSSGERFELLTRLARGWSRSTDYRACWQCKRMVDRRRIDQTLHRRHRSRLPWHPFVVGVPTWRWSVMSRRQRLAHLEARWRGETLCHRPQRTTAYTRDDVGLCPPCAADMLEALAHQGRARLRYHQSLWTRITGVWKFSFCKAGR